MDPRFAELDRWFELSRSGEQELIAAAEQALSDRIHSDPTYPSFLLSAAQLHDQFSRHRDYARHCLTFYGYCSDANLDATDLPGDLTNVPFLEVVSLLIASGADVGSLVAKPLVAVWLATDRQYPLFEQGLLHYRDEISWLSVTVGLLRWPIAEDFLRPFAVLIPEILTLTFEHANQLFLDTVALFFEFFPERDCEDSWAGGLKLLLTFARDCPRPHFERFWGLLGTARSDIAEPFYPIASDLLLQAEIDDLGCVTTLLYFVGQHWPFISDFEGEWKPIMLRMFDTQVRLPNVEIELLSVIGAGRELDLNGAVEFIDEVLTELAGNPNFHPTVLATLHYLSDMFPEFPVFQVDFFEPVLFGTLRNSPDPATVLTVSALFEAAFEALPWVDARSLLGQLCDSITFTNAERVVELIHALLAAPTNEPRNVIFSELCDRLHCFADTGLIAHGIYALALSLLDPLCWISESEIAFLTGLIREYAAVCPIQVAILITVLFQRLPARFANDIGNAVALLAENFDDLPGGFWDLIMGEAARFMHRSISAIFEPLLVRLYDSLRAAPARPTYIVSIYWVLATGSACLAGFSTWLCEQYWACEPPYTDFRMPEALLGAFVVIAKICAPGEWLVRVIEKTLARLPSFFEWPRLWRTSARLFRVAFRRIPDPGESPALLAQALSERFGESDAWPFLLVEGAAKFALSLIRYPELGMTTWFLNWTVNLYHNSDNEAYPKALLRFLRSAISECNRPPAIPLPDFPFAEFLGDLFHGTDWRSQTRAGVYAVLRQLIRREPALVRELVMEAPLEQMTPQRAFCIIGLVALGHLSLGDDVLVDLLPYLERIQVCEVDPALGLIEGCRRAAQSPRAAAMAIHVQCRLLMMAFRPEFAGPGVRARFRPTTVDGVRRQLTASRAQPELFGPLLERWEGEEGRLNDFLDAFLEQ
jgi:hypothetical protein